MIAFKRLKMKKVTSFLDSKEAVKEARATLEAKTEDKFRAFARSKQNVRNLLDKKYLD